MKNKKTDYSILINILFIFAVIAAGLGIYFKIGSNDAERLIQETQQAYQNKIEHPKPSNISQKTPEMVQPPSGNKVLPPFQKYNYKFIYNVKVEGIVTNFNLEMLVPSDEKEKQKIYSAGIEIKPSKLYNDGTNTIAKYFFPEIGNTSFDIVFEGSADVRTYNLETAKALNKNISPEKNLSRYLKSEQYIESDAPIIISTANKIKGSAQEEIIENIYKYLQNTMEYKIVRGNLGAKKALELKYGKCSEFAAAMTALCRAKNIPARIVLGHIAREKQTQHSWVEVYFEKYGWVAFDPTVQPTVVKIYNQQGKLIKQEKRYESNISRLQYIAFGRNKLSSFNLSYSVSGGKNGNVKIAESAGITKI